MASEGELKAAASRKQGFCLSSPHSQASVFLKLPRQDSRPSWHGIESGKPPVRLEEVSRTRARVATARLCRAVLGLDVRGNHRLTSP